MKKTKKMIVCELLPTLTLEQITEMLDWLKEQDYPNMEDCDFNELNLFEIAYEVERTYEGGINAFTTQLMMDKL